MNDARALSRPGSWPRSIYYGWITMTVAALAMVGTLPGRTQGLGLITEPLIRDLGIDRVRFAEINLIATLIGSLFCLGVGRLVDRMGSRVMLTLISLALGVAVILMSNTTAVWAIVVLVTLTRGLGQSALSVVSLAAVGKWFSRRLPSAMAAYTLIMSVGFMVAFPVVGALTTSRGWRISWMAVGIALVAGLSPLAWSLARSTPEESGLSIDGDASALQESGEPTRADPLDGATLQQALRTPAFWVFGVSSALYGLVASGIALFNESILAERGFEASIYHRSLVFTAHAALAGNFAAGGLAARRRSLRSLMVISMVLLAAGLAALPHVTTPAHVMLYAIAMGIAGGFVMVVFFSFWGQTYGRRHLGRIQGAAQALTVVASAVGPLLLAWCVRSTGSYAAAFYTLSAAVLLLTAATAIVHIPTRSRR
jgi:sugar phosphate permease